MSLQFQSLSPHSRPSSAELQLLSPETVLPPPPSPPCTCGKVLADMGPAPLLEPPDWDSHSIDSRFTEESKVGFEPNGVLTNTQVLKIFHSIE